MRNQIQSITAKVSSKIKAPFTPTVDKCIANFGKTQEQLRKVVDANNARLKIAEDREQAAIVALNAAQQNADDVFAEVTLENDRAERVIFNLTMLTK